MAGEKSVLRIAHAGEAGPADVRAIGEVVKQILGVAQLLQHGRALDAGLESRRRDWRRHCETAKDDTTGDGESGEFNWQVVMLGATLDRKQRRRKTTKPQKNTLKVGLGHQSAKRALLA